MHFYFDESGDFKFPDDRFDAYTQAVLICPDSKLPAVEQWVSEAQRRFGVDELHGVRLTDEQLGEVCLFIRTSGLAGIVQGTDTSAVSIKNIEEHRLTAAAQLQANFDSLGPTTPFVAEWYRQAIWRTAHPGKVSHSEWVQADLLVDLFHRAINKSIGYFVDDEWRPDFEAFRFILDGKLTGKLARGERHLDKVLLGFLSSNPERIRIIAVPGWEKSPVHPFHANFSTGTGAVDLRKLFARGLEFEDSRNHAGLQLADVLAYVARRRIIDLRNGTIARAWDLLKPVVRVEKDRYMILRSYGTGGENADLDRYRGIQTDS